MITYPLTQRKQFTKVSINTYMHADPWFIEQKPITRDLNTTIYHMMEMQWCFTKCMVL